MRSLLTAISPSEIEILVRLDGKWSLAQIQHSMSGAAAATFYRALETLMDKGFVAFVRPDLKVWSDASPDATNHDGLLGKVSLQNHLQRQADKAGRHDGRRAPVASILSKLVLRLQPECGPR